MKNALYSALLAALGAAVAWIITRNLLSILIAPILFAALYLVFSHKSRLEARQEREEATSPATLIGELKGLTGTLKACHGTIRNPVIAQRLGSIDTTLSNVLDFLSAEPQEAVKLRSMIKHYLPDLVEAVSLYSKYAKYDVIDEAKFEAYIGMLDDAFITMFKQLFDHKEVAVDVSMDVAAGLLKGSGLLSAKEKNNPEG